MAVIIIIYIAIAIISFYFGARLGIQLIVTATRNNPNKMLAAMGIRVVKKSDIKDTMKRRTPPD